MSTTRNLALAGCLALLLAPAPALAQEAAAAARSVSPYPTRSLSLDAGGGFAVLGGYAYPRLKLDVKPDSKFRAHGKGFGGKLHVDFEAMDLDWRVGVNGTLPGYAGAQGLVGIRKYLTPWQNPRIFVRTGAGLELMFAGSQDRHEFFVPVFLVDGELGFDVSLAEFLTLGAALSVDARYGIPLGGGASAGAFARLGYWF